LFFIELVGHGGAYWAAGDGDSTEDVSVGFVEGYEGVGAVSGAFSVDE
jgi:hypothetical protein